MRLCHQFNIFNLDCFFSYDPWHTFFFFNDYLFLLYLCTVFCVLICRSPTLVHKCKMHSMQMLNKVLHECIIFLILVKTIEL